MSKGKFGTSVSRPVKHVTAPTAPRELAPKAKFGASSGAKVRRQQGKGYGRP
jgi:hypothetical protein